MRLATIEFPVRPLRVRPPGTGIVSQAWTLLFGLFIAFGATMLVIPSALDLVTDFGIPQSAQPVAGGRIDGSCSVHAAVLTSCDATLVAPGLGGPERRRKVDYFFIDFHAGNYRVAVMADPTQPALLTTDLALDKRWNRLITMVTLGPIFLGLALLTLVFTRQQLGGGRATVRALSNQVLRPVLLRMEHYAVGRWDVSSSGTGQAGAPRTWSVPGSARPIVMDPERRLVLGITAGNGAVAMPLDRAMSFVDFDLTERQRVLEQLGPDQLGGWLGALGSASADSEQRRLGKVVRRMGITVAVFVVAAGAAAWVAFVPRNFGDGPRVDLVRGDEGPSSGAVRLTGERQLALAAKTMTAAAGTAALEVWLPITAPGWRREQPVSWIVKDSGYGYGQDRLGTSNGTVMQEPLPPRAQSELRRLGVALASDVRVLEAPALTEDPLYWPAIGVLAVGIAVTLGIGTAALILALRRRRMLAILK